MEELRKEGIIRPAEGANKQKIRELKPWITEIKDWKKFLNIKKGLDFWDHYDQRDYPRALKELVALIYDANRNFIFHGGEIIMIDENVSFLGASIDLLYRLQTKILLKVLEAK